MLLRICSAHPGFGLRYSGFLRNLPTNTMVFLPSLRLSKKQTLARAIRIEKENWGNCALFF